MAKKKKHMKQDENRTGKICIAIILVTFVAVMSVQIHKARQEQLEKIAMEEDLNQQLLEEENRQEELKRYQMYIESEEYVEDVAESKLGLLYENQIIFREIKE